MPTADPRAEAIFLAATEISDATSRLNYLDEICGGDTGLKARIVALLQAHDNPDSLLDRPVVDTGSGRMREKPVVAGPSGTQVQSADPESTRSHQSTHGVDEADDISFLAPPQRPDSLGRIGHYEVLEVLGKGGFGIVFRAFDDKLQRVVAVKVLAPSLATASPARKRFLREARSSARVKHENVVQVYAVEEQPLPHLVMEFVPGETLQQKLDHTGPLELPELLRIGRQVAEGVAAAHATGLIHRDIKPSNILIEAGALGKAKITDFGLARAADDASLTRSGTVAGTPMYMAPEQARGETLDHRADLFSLGSVLYVMSSGRPPFRAENTPAVLKRVTDDTPRPIREIIPEVPEWYCRIVEKLHAKNPEERFQSAREVADVLAGCENQLDERKEMTGFGGITEGKPTAPNIGRWRWISVVGLMASSAIAISLIVLRTPAPQNGTDAPVAKPSSIAPVGEGAAAPAFYDATAYLPFDEHNRKVLDFAEIHGTSPEAAAKWIGELTDGYVPVMLSSHPDANPPQWHGIAVKLTDPPRSRSTFVRWGTDEEKRQEKDIADLKLRYNGGVTDGPRVLRLWVGDTVRWFHWVVPWREQVKMAEEQRLAGGKPLFVLPACGDAPHLMEVRYGGANGLTNWRADFDLTKSQLDGYSKAARGADQFIYHLQARRGLGGKIQYVAICWENPKGYDWDFKYDMTTAEYEAELILRKACGFRPTTITSYGDPANPQYAAAWIRYFDPPKP